MKVIRSEEFKTWLKTQSAKIQALVESRIFRIEYYDHFGDAKHIGEGLSELRWKNGLRLYFARAEARVILLLNGGAKNDQKKDIKKARVLFERYTNS